MTYKNEWKYRPFIFLVCWKPKSTFSVQSSNLLADRPHHYDLVSWDSTNLIRLMHFAEQKILTRNFRAINYRNVFAQFKALLTSVMWLLVHDAYSSEPWRSHKEKRARSQSQRAISGKAAYTIHEIINNIGQICALAMHSQWCVQFLLPVKFSTQLSHLLNTKVRPSWRSNVHKQLDE